MVNTQNVKPIRPFGWKDKISYAMGDFGCNMSFALNSYIQIFYLMYIGLPTWVVSLIILIVKIWDGVNDPIMGAIMDVVKPGKRGKFKTWIFYGSWLLLFAGALSFINTKGLDTWVSVVVFVIGYVVWDFAYTLVNVPYGSLNSAITADQTERSQLSTWRSIGSIVANMGAMILIPALIYKDVLDPISGKPIVIDGVKQQIMLGERMFWIALIMGVIGFVAFQILNHWTVERVKVEPKVDENGNTQKVNYFKALKAFFSNRAAVSLTVAAMLSLIMSSGLGAASAVLYTSYFGEGDSSGIVTMLGMIPMFGVIPLIKPLVKKFGSKAVCVWSLPIGIVGSILMMVVPLPAGMTGMLGWALFSCLTAAGYAAFGMVGWAMVADCIDYQEMQTGERTEGIVYATYSLGRKLAQGFGASLVLLLLGFVGYVSDKENPAAQAYDVACNVKVLIGAIYLVCMVLMFFVLQYWYNLGKKEVDEMQQKFGRANTDFSAPEGME